MQIFKQVPEFDFMGKRKLAVIFSLLLMVISISSLATRGLELGIDFTGGILIEMGYQGPVDLTEVRTALSNNGFDDAIVQHFGTSKDILVRLAPRGDMSNAEVSGDVMEVLQESSSQVPEMRRVEYVGPQVGKELTEDGALAMLFALAGILIYVALRFEYRFALGSVAALVHDVVITLGVFSILGIEFNLTVLAAILAVIGYSLNDTIVVFDRVRENFRIIRTGTTEEVTNVSLNQTLSRTIMTSATTLLVLFALFFVGGELINAFALALIIGVFVGTYSSIYVASTTALALGVSKEDLIPPEREGAEVDDTP
ncbi:Protein translocase subunit SecF [hydrothermal vent metagenome]|uniref:Protein translocase subunit SecF n=1 Tax=hydrothermal vent metagenome TaxID=652676 RepID=A0A3B0ZGT4_9ZZZZ